MTYCVGMLLDSAIRVLKGRPRILPEAIAQATVPSEDKEMIDVKEQTNLKETTVRNLKKEEATEVVRRNNVRRKPEQNSALIRI